MLTHCTVALHVMGSFVQVCNQRGLAYLCLAAPCKVTVIVCYGSRHADIYASCANQQCSSTIS